jgi:hypothetical protein
MESQCHFNLHFFLYSLTNICTSCDNSFCPKTFDKKTFVLVVTSSFAYSLIGLFVWCLIFGMHIFQISSCGSSLHSGHCFLCRAEAFSLMQSHLSVLTLIS